MTRSCKKSPVLKLDVLSFLRAEIHLGPEVVRLWRKERAQNRCETFKRLFVLELELVNNLLMCVEVIKMMMMFKDSPLTKRSVYMTTKSADEGSTGRAPGGR